MKDVHLQNGISSGISNLEDISNKYFDNQITSATSLIFSKVNSPVAQLIFLPTTKLVNIICKIHF